MIFMVDTPKNMEDGYSYVVNRDEDRYTILEGEINLFDKIAFENKEKGINNPYDTIILSFEEEDLTLDEITEIYYEWKELYLSSYDEDEYHLFSVIHWDNKHPHVHVGIINNSMINGKKLRMTRYGIDNNTKGRNAAIQEIINYKYNLASPIGAKTLFPTTPKQKIRDWKVGKGKEYYDVEDDHVYSFLKKMMKKSQNYSDFFSLIKEKYPSVQQLNNYNNEGRIKIEEKFYSSILFNKEFFNSHLEEIKQSKEDFDLEERESENFYKELYEKTNFAHKKELAERNIHEGLFEYKINRGELNFLKYSFDLEKEFENIRKYKELDLSKKKNRDYLKENILKIKDFIFCKEDLEQFFDYIDIELERVGYDIARGGGFFVLKRNDNKKMYVNSNDLYDVYNRPRNSIEYIELVNQRKFDKQKKMIQEIPLNKRENIDVIRDFISAQVVELTIDNADDFKLFCSDYGIDILSTGYSIQRGGYITIKLRNKKISLYDDLIHSFFNEDIELKDIGHNNDLLKSSILDENGVLKPESIYEFQLKESDDIDMFILNRNYDELNLDLNKKDRNRKEKYIIDDNTDALVLKKTIDIDAATDRLAKEIKSKEWDDIKVSGTDIEYQRALIQHLMYLSGETNSDKWIQNIKLTTDFYDNQVNIRKGIVYEIEEENLLDINLEDNHYVKVVKKNRGTEEKEEETIKIKPATGDIRVLTTKNNTSFNSLL